MYRSSPGSLLEGRGWTLEAAWTLLSPWAAPRCSHALTHGDPVSELSETKPAPQVSSGQSPAW